MNNKATSRTVFTAGLAIFSMLFGAGNLIYPLYVGMVSGDLNTWGMCGFLLTAALLPILGFIAMLLFNGDYNSFFNRLGPLVGQILIFLSMLIIGPLIAIPRITTLSHTMIAPFIPFALLQTITPLSSFIFSLLFLGVTFLGTYRENKIVSILGNIVSPLLLFSLSIIIIKGFFSAQMVAHNANGIGAVFRQNAILGYGTLDLFGALFFSSIVLNILHATHKEYSTKETIHIGIQSGIIGILLLSLVYWGISLLGVYHGHNLAALNPGELFRHISWNVVGAHGAAIIATAVLMACLSTSIALSAVVAGYIQNLFHIDYIHALSLLILTCIPIATAGLTSVITLTKVIASATYPAIIMLTLCNIGYKLVGFKPVKLPVFIIFIITLLHQAFF
ncbi:MAG: branched-chain amino acid transport system II carrier protein [Candidatus Babeliales bacterium]